MTDRSALLKYAKLQPSSGATWGISVERSKSIRNFAMVCAMLGLLTAHAFSQPSPTSASAPDRFADSVESIERYLNAATKEIAEIRERRKRCETDSCRMDYDQAIEGGLQLIALRIEYRLARLHNDADTLGLVEERYRAALGKAEELNNRLYTHDGPVPTCGMPCARQ